MRPAGSMLPTSAFQAPAVVATRAVSRRVHAAVTRRRDRDTRAGLLSRRPLDASCAHMASILAAARPGFDYLRPNAARPRARVARPHAQVRRQRLARQRFFDARRQPRRRDASRDASRDAHALFLVRIRLGRAWRTQRRPVLVGPQGRARAASIQGDHLAHPAAWASWCAAESNALHTD